MFAVFGLLGLWSLWSFLSSSIQPTCPCICYVLILTDFTCPQIVSENSPVPNAMTMQATLNGGTTFGLITSALVRWSQSQFALFLDYSRCFGDMQVQCLCFGYFSIQYCGSLNTQTVGLTPPPPFPSPMHHHHHPLRCLRAIKSGSWDLLLLFIRHVGTLTFPVWYIL